MSAASNERRIIRRCEGLLAHRAGRPASANPHLANTVAAQAWAFGWLAAAASSVKQEINHVGR